MNTPAELVAAIAHASHEVAALKLQNSRLPSLRNELAAANAGYTLNPTPEAHARLERISNELAAAVAAQEQLSIKQASIGLLENELALARSAERKQAVEGITQNFDNLKARYAADAEALLSLFRQMDHLHRQYLAATGTALLWERDYTLNLPTCNSLNDAGWATTGSMVRA